MNKIGLVLIALIVFIAPPATVHAGYPGAAMFSYQCNPDSISFFYKADALFKVSFAQISGPLAAALATNQNQPIFMSDPASLWALKSNEFQIHLNENPDATKLVWSTSICGQISAQPVAFIGQAFAYVRVTGMGQAVAYARVNAFGQVFVYVMVSGTGQAFAAAQSSIVAPPPSSPISGTEYVVQPGDTLFSIARRSNTAVATLVQLNNLLNPNLIVVGQTIRLQ